jgi:hypothetical protein
MKYGAIRASDRQALFKIAQIERAVTQLLNESATDIRVDYRSTVSTFKKPPTFFIHRLTRWERHIYTENFNYYRLDELGSPPHIIRPKRAKVLAFPANYSRKTRFKTLAAFNGGKSGKMIYATRVKHPGFKPILITETIGEKWEKWFQARYDRQVAPLLEK